MYFLEQQLTIRYEYFFNIPSNQHQFANISQCIANADNISDERLVQKIIHSRGQYNPPSEVTEESVHQVYY
jgi:hypothetical protein